MKRGKENEKLELYQKIRDIINKSAPHCMKN